MNLLRSVSQYFCPNRVDAFSLVFFFFQTPKPMVDPLTQKPCHSRSLTMPHTHTLTHFTSAWLQAVQMSRAHFRELKKTILLSVGIIERRVPTACACAHAHTRTQARTDSHTHTYTQTSLLPVKCDREKLVSP